jgi:hypothetical protein
MENLMKMKDNSGDINQKKTWERPALEILNVKKTKGGDQEWDYEDEIYINPLS